MIKRLQVLPYDSRWPIEFEEERDRLAAALGQRALRIEHNGSTAVPGLAAKPVIDIQVSVVHLQPIERYAVPLPALGYTHVAHPDDAFCPSGVVDPAGYGGVIAEGMIAEPARDSRVQRSRQIVLASAYYRTEKSVCRIAGPTGYGCKSAAGSVSRSAADCAPGHSDAVGLG